MPALNFAVVSKDPALSAPLERFCQSLSLVTRLNIAPMLLASHAELIEKTRAGEAQLMWAPPLVAIELEDERLATPIVVVQRSIRAGYHSALFVRADSKLQRVEDLGRSRVAWVSRDSASGYFAPRWHLRSMGIKLSEVFSEEQICGSHEDVTRAVSEGRADVGATHVHVDPVSGKLAAAPWLSMGGTAAMRVILLVGPIPGDVISISSRVDAHAKRHLVQALVVTKDDADARLLFEASRFEPVPEGHLNLLRRLARYSETRA